MTHASVELIQLMLADSANVQEYRSQETGQPPLYNR